MSRSITTSGPFQLLGTDMNGSNSDHSNQSRNMATTSLESYLGSQNAINVDSVSEISPLTSWYSQSMLLGTQMHGNRINHSNPLPDGTFSCSKCGKVLGTKESLYNHMILHRGKEYRCELCFKVFNHPNNFRQHQRVVHESKRFQCILCGRKFSTKQNYKYHIDTLHGVSHNSGPPEDTV